MREKVNFVWDIHYRCNFRCPFCWFNGKWDELDGLNRNIPVAKLVGYWHRVLAFAGEAFRQEGDMDTAVRFFDAAINRNPNAPETYFFRALLEVRERRSEEAIGDFARAAELGGYDIPDEEIIKTVFK